MNDSPVDIRRIIIHDDAGLFSIDNLTLGSTSSVVTTPVPGAVALCAVGLGLVGVVRRRLRRRRGLTESIRAKRQFSPV